MTLRLFVFFLTASLSTFASDHATFFALCAKNARRLVGLKDPSPIFELSVPGDTKWLKSEGKVLLNGSLIAVSDQSGNPRTILVLSHYMEGHVRKDVPLPAGWKFIGFRHRGEYEFLDGKLARVNNTSGTAFKNEENNPIGLAEDYLAGSQWASPATRFIAFTLGNEHFYPAFNRKPPPDVNQSRTARDAYLHGGRTAARLQMSFLSFLIRAENQLPSPEACQRILDHWDVQTAGASDNPDLVFLKQMLQKQVNSGGRALGLDPYHFEIMHRGLRRLLDERKAYQYVEIR